VNESLLRYLEERYVLRESPSEEPYVSSHWSRCLELLKIETGAGGRVLSVSTKDAGLDTFTRKGFAASVFDACSMLCHWLSLPGKIGILKLSARALTVCRAMKRPFTFDVFRQLYCLSEILRNLSPEIKSRRLSALMIGDGYGILSAVLKSAMPQSTLVLVDLGKVLFLQAYLCQRAHPEMTHRLFNEAGRLETADFVYCPAEKLESLTDFRFNLAVNIVSMHEMSFPVISGYFDFLRRTMKRSNLFYCCNREFKELAGGEKTDFKDYPWSSDDRIIFDGACPWHRYYFARHLSENGPRPGGVRIPFVNYYHSRKSGKIRHRLAVLALDRKDG